MDSRLRHLKDEADALATIAGHLILLSANMNRLVEDLSVRPRFSIIEGGCKDLDGIENGGTPLIVSLPENLEKL